MPKKLDLVKEAVSCWANDNMSAEESMWAIWAVLFNETPNDEAMSWARSNHPRKDLPTYRVSCTYRGLSHQWEIKDGFRYCKVCWPSSDGEGCVPGAHSIKNCTCP